jgi:hypothetical protein
VAGIFHGGILATIAFAQNGLTKRYILYPVAWQRARTMPLHCHTVFRALHHYPVDAAIATGLSAVSRKLHCGVCADGVPNFPASSSQTAANLEAQNAIINESEP